MVPDAHSEGRGLAITAQALYLVNLMLLPGLAFLVLLLIFAVSYRNAPVLARNHLAQTLGVSALGGSLIVLVLGAIYFGGGAGPYAWLWGIMYFTFVHTSLIFIGVFGFNKAMNGQEFVFPVVGRLFKQ
ncbi:MAG: hypothetical protein AAFX56_09540 [Pseudomonadota bacterium]